VAELSEIIPVEPDLVNTSVGIDIQQMSFEKAVPMWNGFFVLIPISACMIGIAHQL
jgi:hypothetical protein